MNDVFSQILDIGRVDEDFLDDVEYQCMVDIEHTNKGLKIEGLEADVERAVETIMAYVNNRQDEPEEIEEIDEEPEQELTNEYGIKPGFKADNRHAKFADYHTFEVIELNPDNVTAKCFVKEYEYTTDPFYPFRLRTKYYDDIGLKWLYEHATKKSKKELRK